MKFMQLDWNKKADQQEVIEALRRGNVILGTTDTVLGLLADTTLQGFDQLNHIKGRQHKPYLILIGSSNNLRHFVSFPLPEQTQKIVDACWPGPLTIIFKAKSDLPSHLVAADGTIAIRIPNHAGLLTVLDYFNGLYSTSANFAGEPVAATVESLDARLYESVAHLIVDSKTDKSASLPSTIIDCSQDTIKIVREGAFTHAMLAKIME